MERIFCFFHFSCLCFHIFSLYFLFKNVIKITKNCNDKDDNKVYDK